MDEFFTIAGYAGRLHPLLVHFPIATVLVAFFHSFLRKNEQTTNCILWGFSFVSAILASLTGFANAQAYSISLDGLPTHGWLGLSAVIAVGIRFFLSRQKVSSSLQSSRLKHIVGFLSVVSVFAAGYWGGYIAFGRGYLPMTSGNDTFDHWNSVQAVLNRRCLRCHSGASPQGDLDLSSLEGIARGGEFGPVIVANDPQSSPLYLSIVAPVDSKKHMPLNRGMIPNEEVDIIRTWIQSGAINMLSNVSDRLIRQKEVGWAYQKIVKPQLPNTSSSVLSNPIDIFLFEENVRKSELTPIAEKRQILRRASLLLRGRPLAIEEARAANKLSDSELDSTLMNYLDSNEFGETWASFWLDLIRFGETSGYEEDQDLPGGFRFRNFVIQALKTDMPFDHFLRLQLSGDKHQPPGPNAKVATGFLSLHAFNSTANDPNEAAQERLDELIHTTVASTLGVEFRCARCHNHKNEPISQLEYYGFRFGMQDAGLRPKDVRALEYGVAQAQSDTLKLHQIGSEKDGPIFLGGDYNQVVGSTGLRFLSAYQGSQSDPKIWKQKHPNSSPRELIALWLTDPEEGVGRFVARVVVNNIWSQYFGRGLVDTIDGFGDAAEKPKHIDLLNFLALELIHKQWSLKHIHQLILTSRAFKAPTLNSKNIQPDYLYWQPFRMKAETLRDSMVYLAGGLRAEPPKISLQPPTYLQSTEYDIHANPWVAHTTDTHVLGRSIYIKEVRNFTYPVLQALGKPDRYEVRHQRPKNNGLSESLFFFNSEFMQDMANRWLLRFSSIEGNHPQWLEHIFVSALSRMPNDDEFQLFSQYLKEPRPLTEKHKAIAQVLLASNEFVFIR
jgi:hypothetical protein